MNKILRTLLAILALALGLINASQATETITYFHEDAGGSPIAATDEAGNLLWRESYQPYGDRLKKQDGNTNKIWFHGKQQDADTGLSYFGARYYDPVVGRFMGVDPQGYEESNPHSFNRYAYGNNNPYKFVDPDGRFPLAIFIPLIWAGGGAAISGGTNAAVQYGTTGKIQWGGIGGVKDAAGDGAIMGPAFAPFAAREAAGSVAASASKSTTSESTVVQTNPSNLIPTQTRSEMSGSQVKRLEKDMKQRGYDQTKPVDATRRADGRLEIQDGHHRTEAAKHAGIDKIPVRVHDKRPTD